MVNKPNGYSLPHTLPYSIEGDSNSTNPVPQRAIATMTEKSWDFLGIILEETIVAEMHFNIMLVETVLARILAKALMVDRNSIRIEWYAGNVATVQVLKKYDIDNEYQKVGEPIPWDEGGVTVTIDDAAYHLKLVGNDRSGESGVIEIADTKYSQIKTQLELNLNEKLHYVNIEFVDEFTIPIDF